ncbi:MAG: hypothetical protein DLM52_01750 [Chthoniobacterales bacterium]|nr:MAG: hypothetical protein DLM52_01750 [Chthoniobacterales bacterium]
MVIVGIAAEYTMTVQRHVDRSNTLESAVAMGDGCIDHNFALWRQMCQNGLPGNPTPTTNQLTTGATALRLPTAAEFPNVTLVGAPTRSNYNPNATTTIQQCKVIAVDPWLNPLNNSDNPRLTNAGEIGDGTVTYNYLASAYVTLPTIGPKKNVVAKVQRVLQAEQDSFFNYAIYYNDTLEIHPGPPFNVTGWVHTNGDLYTGHDTLNFSQKATFGSVNPLRRDTDPGGWTVGFRPPDKNGDGNDTAHNGQTPASPTGVKPTSEPNAPTASNPSIDPTTFDPSNPNNTGYHELIEPPSSGSDPFQGSRYYDQAGVVIQVDATNNVTIGQSNGAGGFTNIGPPISGADPRTTAQKQLYKMFNTSGVITTNGSIQDNREGSSPTRVVTLDVGKLTTPNSSATNGVQWNISSQANFNGVVYIYDTSGSSTVKRGIKVTDGSTLPAGGMTIASQNPVYLQGDFNTGVNPPSNSGDPTKPEGNDANGNQYNRQPSSILADAVNILSNAWNDSVSGTVPDASPTTVNTAIVSGIVTNGPGFTYTGGAENFPRFLEDWSGKNFTYYGSMIELYNSQQAIGVWGKDNVYSPPNRKWYFDKNFKVRVPPGGNAFMNFKFSKGKWALVP